MATTNSNFVAVTTAACLEGSAVNAAPQILVCDPGPAVQQAAASGNILIDKRTSDLATAGYAKNAAFYLTLAANTPATVDLTTINTVVTSTVGVAGGDNVFATINEVIIFNNGANPVIIGAGTNPFLMGMTGTTPKITITAGGSFRWKNPAGTAVVTATNAALKFDPAALVCTLCVAVGGA